MQKDYNLLYTRIQYNECCAQYWFYFSAFSVIHLFLLSSDFQSVNFSAILLGDCVLYDIHFIPSDLL